MPAATVGPTYQLFVEGTQEAVTPTPKKLPMIPPIAAPGGPPTNAPIVVPSAMVGVLLEWLPLMIVVVPVDWPPPHFVLFAGPLVLLPPLVLPPPQEPMVNHVPCAVVIESGTGAVGASHQEREQVWPESAASATAQEKVKGLRRLTQHRDDEDTWSWGAFPQSFTIPVERVHPSAV